MKTGSRDPITYPVYRYSKQFSIDNRTHRGVLLSSTIEDTSLQKAVEVLSIVKLSNQGSDKHFWTFSNRLIITNRGTLEPKE